MVIEYPVQEKAWYALYTKPKSEYKAAEQLRSIGVQYYLPVITRQKQWSDRKKKSSEIILKGYIFIFADEKERSASLEEYSVVRCVFDNGRPAKIPEWQIQNLKNMLAEDGEFLIKDGLIPGKRVIIKEGPFQGIIGVIQESDNEHYLVVSVDLLNRSIIARLPKESRFELIKEYHG